MSDLSHDTEALHVPREDLRSSDRGRLDERELRSRPEGDDSASVRHAASHQPFEAQR